MIRAGQKLSESAHKHNFIFAVCNYYPSQVSSPLLSKFLLQTSVEFLLFFWRRKKRREICGQSIDWWAATQATCSLRYKNEWTWGTWTSGEKRRSLVNGNYHPQEFSKLKKTLSHLIQFALSWVGGWTRCSPEFSSNLRVLMECIQWDVHPALIIVLWAGQHFSAIGAKSCILT